MKKIESIEKYKGNTYCISFSEEEEKEYLNIDIICEYHLKAGMSVPASAWEDIVYANKLRTAETSQNRWEPQWRNTSGASSERQ